MTDGSRSLSGPYRTRGIGSEFGLSPSLLIPHKLSSHGPFRKGHCVWPNSGRAAILWALRALRQLDHRRSTCLLPAYVCPSVVQPFKQAGVSIEFYRVDDHLQVDPDDLLSRVTPDVLAVFIIHYFGFLQPETVFDLLEGASPTVYTIEDVTHSWLSCSADGTPIGQRGTILVCSPRKFFPVPDGAVAITADSSVRLDVSVGATDWAYALRRTAGLLLRWLFAKTGSEVANRLAFSLLGREESKLNSAISMREASFVSKRILLNVDSAAASMCRRRNYRILAEGLRHERTPVQPLVEKLPLGVTPLGFPIICARRNELREFLIERRIYPPIHWALPHEEGITGFKHLTELSEHILTLPIDQRYGPGDMNYILACLAEWNARA